MELDLKLQFPDDQAAAVLHWLRGLPSGAIQLVSKNAKQNAGAAPNSADLAERERRFLALFGAWQSEETGDELNRKLQEARHTEQRDIDL